MRHTHTHARTHEMQLFVRCLGGRTLALQLPADSCVASLRREVEVRRLFFLSFPDAGCSGRMHSCVQL